MHDLHELVGHFIALVVRELPLQAEVLRAAVVAAGDKVPAGASIADVVQRVGQAGEQERVVSVVDKVVITPMRDVAWIRNGASTEGSSLGELQA